jgi:hypothetical protein
MAKKSKLSFIAMMACVCGLATVTSFADTAKTTTATAQQYKLIEHISAGFLSAYYGAAISHPFNSYMPNTDGTLGDPQTTEDFIDLYYKLSDTRKIGVRAHFFATPVDSQGITMLDPLIQYVDSSIYKRGNFVLSGFARAYLPFTSESTKNDRIIQFRFLLNPAYDIPKTKWSVGVVTYAQPALFSSTKSGQITFTGYVGPNVSYQLTKTVAVSAVYEMAMTHKRGTDKDFFNF